MKQLKKIFSLPQSISGIFLFYTFIVTIIGGTLFGGFWAVKEIIFFQQEATYLREEQVDKQKDLLKEEIEKVFNRIDYHKESADSLLRENLKMRVSDAYDICWNIYQKNKEITTDVEIKFMILHALEKIKFNKGRATYCILDEQGRGVLLPAGVYFEGKTFYDFPQIEKQYNLKQNFQLVKTKGEATFNWFPYKADNDTVMNEKVGYFVYFEPFGWYIGSGDYYNANTGDIQNDILSEIKDIRFGNNNMLFVNTFSGSRLVSKGKLVIPVTDGWDITDNEGIEIVKNEIQKAANSNGAFIDYDLDNLETINPQRKVIFIKVHNEWEWIVGATAELSDIDVLIEEKRLEKQKSLWNVFFKILAALALFLMLVMFVAKWLSIKLKSNFLVFGTFFQNAVVKSQEIDANNLNFVEFKELAITANEMLYNNKQAKELIEDEKRKLRDLIDSIPDLIFFKDLNSNYLGCNKAFEKIMLKKQQEIIGKSDIQLFRTHKSEFYHALDKIVIESQEVHSYEEWIEINDSEKILLNIVKTPYYNAHGKVLGIIGICHNITDFRLNEIQLKEAKEKAEQADKLKSAFLANMSHEIRTPMNAIIGFSQLLENGDISEETKTDYLQHIRHSGKTLLNLINDIIDIAKIEAGQIQIHKEDCLLNFILDELLATYEEVRIARNKADVKLIVIKEFTDSNIAIFTDPFRLQQILANLIGNALKFTTKGSITFGYTTENNNLLFFVKDTGVGIDKEAHNLIFERFGQADSKKIDNKEGTGLGLAISKNLVELLGGKIWIESEVDKGSNFFFTIPLQIVENSEKVRKEQQNNVKYSWKNLKILIADDNNLNLKLINDTLIQYDSEVKLVLVENGELAYQKLQTEKFDVAIFDVRMPLLDGITLTKNIRNTLKLSNKELPILGLSAHALKEEKQICISAGMDEYLTKPFLQEDLYFAVNNLLGSKATIIHSPKQMKLKNNDNFKKVDFFETSFLKKIYKNDFEKISNAINICLTDIPQQIEQMENDFENKNWKDFAATAHGLKTTFHYLGLRELMPLSKMMEKIADGNYDKQFIDVMLLEMKIIWSEASKKLKSIL